MVYSMVSILDFSASLILVLVLPSSSQYMKTA